MRQKLGAAAVMVCVGLATPLAAQYTGPSETGETASVAAAAEAGFGTYVTVTGRLIRHLREDYYLLADETGEITVEIEPRLFAGRPVGAETLVTIVGEVDRRLMGQRYIWVTRLDLP